MIIIDVVDETLGEVFEGTCTALYNTVDWRTHAGSQQGKRITYEKCFKSNLPAQISF